MEELIRKNKLRSMILLIAAFVIMLIVGYVLGDLLYSYMGIRFTSDFNRGRLYFALGFAAFIGILQLVRTYLIFNSKPRQLFKLLRLQPAEESKFSKLNNVIAEMSIASGLPVPPKAYIIPSPALNAMAFGTDPGNAAIAVTSGLLSICNRDELQGVVAHEMSHILNRDILFLEVCRSTLGMVIILRNVMLRSVYWGSAGGAHYRTRSSGKGKSSNIHAVFIIFGIIFAIIAPLLIRIIYFAISREREYLADAESARMTRFPAGLASALTKIAYSTHSMDDIDKVTSASFIDQPYGDVIITKKGCQTHPPIWNRIRVLKNITKGAGFVDYQKAYNEVMQKKAEFIPAALLVSGFSAPLRNSESLTDEPDFIENKDQFDKLGNTVRSEDITRLSEDYGFVNCECGLKIKIPPDYKKVEIKCPRCGRIHFLEKKMERILSAMIDETNDNNAAAGILHEVMIESMGKPDYSGEKEQIFQRTGKKWEEITCRCGTKIQLSPTFIGTFIRCRKCKRKINIV